MALFLGSIAMLRHFRVSIWAFVDSGVAFARPECVFFRVVKLLNF